MSDPEGTVLTDREAARNEAIKVLPQVARDALPDGEQHRFQISAREEGQKPFYRAELTFNGEWLDPNTPS